MPLLALGTNTTFSTLQATMVSVYDFGIDRVWDGTASLVNDYNIQVNELTGDLMDTSTDRIRSYGTVTNEFNFQDLDEFGTPNAQTTLPGSVVGFPLRTRGAAIQWSRTWAKVHSVKDLAGQVLSVISGDRRRLRYDILNAFFSGIDYSFIDKLVDQKDSRFPLPIRALLNADGEPIPPGPNGITFDPTTHTHYMATATLTDTWALSLVENLREHYEEGNTIIWIERTDAPAWEALTNFKPLVYSTTIKSYNQEYGEGDLSTTDQYNRIIGFYDGAAVWVKPTMVSGYCLAYQTGVPQPLVKRIRGINTDSSGTPAEDAGNLTILYEDETHPLYARAWEREYGISVWNRTNGVCGMYGGSTYVKPVFPL